MGQKTHPLGFRLGITQTHKSVWYANFKHYRELIKEDYQILVPFSCNNTLSLR